MWAYTLSRLLVAVPSLLIAASAIFLIMRVLPGDVASSLADQAAGEGQTVNPEVLEALRERLGLRDPLPVQYLNWLRDLFTGNMGRSFLTNEPVITLIGRHMPATIQLTFATFVLASVVGISLGVLCAARQDSWIDQTLRSFAVLGLSIPSFWAAILLILGLVLFFHWIPPLQYRNLWEDPLQHLEFIIWPASVLGWAGAAAILRMTRNTVLEVIHEDYIRTANSKGLVPLLVLRRHVIRNALIPVTAFMGVQIGHLLSGAVVIETIFGVPGIGSAAVQAVRARDYPVEQGVLVLFVAIALVANLLVDVLNGVIDPRLTVK